MTEHVGDYGALTEAVYRQAISARGAKERWPQDQVCAAYWEGYLKALVDVTGLAPTVIEAELEVRLP